MKKRGIALYRVSTDKQDEQMQRRKVREYSKLNNIEIIDEYVEFDVSGYKTSLKDRKELLKILARAEEQKDFDYLLVYIFDRIIRREDEAPFVLSHLSKYGIEAIEVTTGEHLKNEDMTDKLMNYIRFWNAEYESVKTSQRVSDALRTKNENNAYAGGRPPFGYELYNTGQVSKKGRMLKELKINENEAWIIRDIFDMYVNKRMGTLSIAEELNTNPMYRGKNRPKRRKDKENPNIVHEIPVNFRQGTLPKLLRNTIYIGRRRYNTVETYRDGTKLLPQEEWQTQEYRDDLRIIDDDIFMKAQELLVQNRVEPKKLMKGTTKSGVLCSGLAYCECGSKLYSSFSNYRYTRKDGSVGENLIYRYVCRSGREINKLHKEKYGKTYYAAKKYDKLIEKTIIEYLEHIDIEKLKSEIENYNKYNIGGIELQIGELKKEKEQCNKNINTFEKKMDDDIDNIDIYIKGMRRNELRAKEIEKQIDVLTEELNKNKQDDYDYKFIYNNFKDYYDKFVKGNQDEKKVVLDQLVNKIIFKNNGVEIVLKRPIKNSLVYNDSMYLPLYTSTHGVSNTQKTIGVITANFNN